MSNLSEEINSLRPWQDYARQSGLRMGQFRSMMETAMGYERDPNSKKAALKPYRLSVSGKGQERDYTIGYGHYGPDVTEYQESGAVDFTAFDEEKAQSLLAKDLLGKMIESREIVPSFDTFSFDLRSNLVMANFRGDLKQSPRFVNKLESAARSGKRIDFDGAADEFLNHEEFNMLQGQFERGERKQPHQIALRLQAISDSVRKEGELVEPNVGALYALKSSGVRVDDGLDERMVGPSLVNAIVKSNDFFLGESGGGLSGGSPITVRRMRDEPNRSVQFMSEAKTKESRSAHALGNAADIYVQNVLPGKEEDLEKRLQKRLGNKYSVRYEAFLPSGVPLEEQDRHFHIEALS